MYSSQDIQQPSEGHLNVAVDLANQDHNQPTRQTENKAMAQSSLEHLVTATSDQ